MPLRIVGCSVLCLVASVELSCYAAGYATRSLVQYHMSALCRSEIFHSGLAIIAIYFAGVQFLTCHLFFANWVQLFNWVEIYVCCVGIALFLPQGC